MEKIEFLHIPDASLVQICKFYDQTETNLTEKVRILQNWLKTQKHLPEIMDQDRLRNFLILNKLSIEKTKQRIDMYYTARSLFVDIYTRINPKLPNMTDFTKIAYFVPLPRLTPDMYRVVFYKMRDKTLIDRMEPHDVIGHILNVQELRLCEDIMFGDVIVYDLEGVTLTYLKKLTPTLIANIFTIYEEIYSIPLKAMLILNSPPFINFIMAILKSCMKQKLFQRIELCENTNLLHEKLPKSIIPSDYGGDSPSLEELQNTLKVKFHEYQERFDDLDEMTVDESQRPIKLNNDELLGFYGNFKKLTVD